MTKRHLYATFWRDAFIRKLSAPEKLLFLYFISVEAVNSLYCFEVDDEDALFDTKVSPDELREFKKKVEEAGKMYFFKSWVFLANAKRYDNYSGALVEKGRQGAFSRLPKDVQTWFLSVSDDDNQIKPAKATSTKPASSLDQDVFEEPSEEPKPAEAVDNDFDELPAAEAKPTPKAYRTIEYLTEMNEEEASRFAEKYKKSVAEIRAQAERCANDIRAKGKRRSDYRASLHNWMTSSYYEPIVEAEPGVGEILELPGTADYFPAKY